jgi:hypothetical protein
MIGSVGWMKLRSSIIQLSVVIMVFGACGDAASAAPKRVLLLHSFGLDARPWSEYSSDIRTELFRKFPHDIDLFEATLETARLPGDVDDGPFADYLAALFKTRPLDLVITVAIPASRFVQRQRQRLFPATPHLIAGSEQRSYVNPTDANGTAVLTAIDFLAVVKNILQVLPATERIAVVLGASPLERYWQQQIELAVEPLKHRVVFMWFNDLSFDEMLKSVSTLPPKSAVFFGALSVDAKGVPQIDRKVFFRFRDASNAPIFSYEDSYFGSGLVGGPMLSVIDTSRRVVETAARILAG